MRDETKTRATETRWEQQRIHTENLKNELFKEYGVENHPRANIVFDLAYEHGHSSGDWEIRNLFRDFVKLILPD